MLIQRSHCGEIIETMRTADETGLEIGDWFRLVSCILEFKCCDINRDWPKSPVCSGVTADGKHYTQARLADVVRLHS